MARNSPDVIRTIDGTEVKDFLPRQQVHTPVLHRTWITAACRIYGKAIQVETGRQAFFKRLVLPFLYGAASNGAEG